MKNKLKFGSIQYKLKVWGLNLINKIRGLIEKISKVGMIPVKMTRN
jgi:hypothetical protein